MPTLQRNAFKVRMYQRIMGFANSLASLPNKLVPPPFRLIQIGSAYWQSRALFLAAKLGVADAIGDGEKACDAIAEKLQLHADHLYRLLRMLASIGVFEESQERHFRNNKLSHCLRRDSPQCVRDMILLHNSPQMSQAWFEALEGAISSGTVPFAQCHGEELFDYLDHHPSLDTLFTAAMESVEALAGTDFLEDFDLGGFDRLIDVGGNNGSKALTILKRYPQMQGLIFDRPQVIENAIAQASERLDLQLQARVEFVAGDMLQAIPSAQSDRDIYLFIAIFHGMSDVQAVIILRNLRAACAHFHPTIAILDCVAEAQNIDATVASFDMQMLVGTSGRERTKAEWCALFAQGGFALQEIVSLRTFARLLVIKVLP